MKHSWICLLALSAVAQPPAPPGFYTQPVPTPKAREQTITRKIVNGPAMVNLAPMSTGALSITSITRSNNQTVLTWAGGIGPFMVQTGWFGAFSAAGPATMLNTRAITSTASRQLYRVQDSYPLLTATRSNETTSLQWETPEIVSDAFTPFVVQRSADGSSWNNLSPSISPSGPYRFVDSATPNPTWLYRVAETTSNGVVVPFNTVRVGQPWERVIGDDWQNVGILGLNGVIKYNGSYYMHVNRQGGHSIFIWSDPLMGDLRLIGLPSLNGDSNASYQFVDGRFIIAYLSIGADPARVFECNPTEPNFTEITHFSVGGTQNDAPRYVSSCKLSNGGAAFFFQKTQLGVGSQGEFYVAYRSPAPDSTWDIYVDGFGGSSGGYTPYVAQAGDGTIWVLCTRDSSGKIALLTYEVSGTTLVRTSVNFDYINDGRAVPQAPGIDIDGEFPPIAVASDPTNSRFILAYGDEYHPTSNPYCGNHHPTIVSAPWNGAARTLIAKMPWLQNRFNPILLQVGSSGIKWGCSDIGLAASQSDPCPYSYWRVGHLISGNCPVYYDGLTISPPMCPVVDETWSRGWFGVGGEGYYVTSQQVPYNPPGPIGNMTQYSMRRLP